MLNSDLQGMETRVEGGLELQRTAEIECRRLRRGRLEEQDLREGLLEEP